MPHSHSHGHDHAPVDFSRAFFIGIALNSAFVIAEVVFGFLANSMALLADAGHNFSDVLGLAMAWAGAIMAKRPGSDKFTYGLKKAPILAALFNAILLLVAIGAILLEAVQRLIWPETSNGGTVMAVAGVGIAVNAVTAWLFASGRKRDVNIRGAYLHMAADAGVSLAVVVAGGLIVLTGLEWIDPIMSILVGMVILWGTFGLLKESTWMSLAGVPPGMSLDAIERALREVAGVEALHDLHVWPMSTTENALTVHLVVREESLRQQVLTAAGQLLEERFHLHHSTIQIEAEVDGDCADC